MEKILKEQPKIVDVGISMPAASSGPFIGASQDGGVHQQGYLWKTSVFIRTQLVTF